MAKKEKLQELTPKQRKFAAEYVKTGDRAGSAMKVYDVGNRDYARALAHKTFHKPHVNSHILELLAKRGVEDEVVSYINDGLKATKWVQVEGREEVPDMAARRDAAKHYEEIKQTSKASTQVLHLENSNHTNYELTADTPQNVLNFVLENDGKLPDEKKLERLLAENKRSD